MKSVPCSPVAPVIAATLLIASGQIAANASTLYWGVDTASNPVWSSASSWYEDAAGTTVATSAPTALDDVVFYTTPLNAVSLVPKLNNHHAANSITFNNTVSTTVESNNGTARNLVIGSGGVAMAAGAGSVTLGNSSATINVRFGADQTWTNNSDNTLRIRNNAASADNAGDVTLTFNAAGSGTITNSGPFNDGTNSTLAIVVDSTGTGTVSMQNSSYSGGTTIKRGILQASGSSIGTQTVKLGDTTGSGNATLRINTTSAIATGLDVQAGNTGTSTLEFVSTNALGGTYEGDISLNDSLHIGVNNVTGGATINGVISGSGDLVKGQFQGGNSGILVLTGANTYTGDTLITNGAFTLAETGSLTFLIGSNGVNNQVSGSSSGAVIFEGMFVFDVSGASVTDGDSWTIVDKSALTNTSFASTFNVSGFTETDGVWTDALGFSFSELTGVLSFTGTIPEPSAASLLGALAALGFASTGRRRTRA